VSLNRKLEIPDPKSQILSPKRCAPKADRGLQRLRITGKLCFARATCWGVQRGEAPLASGQIPNSKSEKGVQRGRSPSAFLFFSPMIGG